MISINIIFILYISYLIMHFQSNQNIAISMKDIHHDNRHQQGIELNEVSKVIGYK